MKNIDKLLAKLKGKNLQVKWLPIHEVLEDPENPRIISEEDFESLKQSIKDFPEMMLLRPGIIDAENKLKGSNQRHRACVELGWTEFPVIYAEGLTPEQLDEFMIKDNLSAGSWNTDVLFKDWDLKDLEDWKFDMTLLDVRPPEFSQIGQPAPKETLKHQKSITLKYAEKDWQIVKDKLAAVADTPEHAVWILLGLEKPKKGPKKQGKGQRPPAQTG